MDIATLIKEYRTKTGMTQQELADKVFVTRQTISKWELGKSEPDNVSLDLLFKEMNIEKESQKDIKANLISRKNILLIIIAVLFSPSILIIRLLVLKIGKIENKRLVILINTFQHVACREMGTSTGQDSLRIHSSRQDVSFKIFTFCITRKIGHIDKNRIIFDLKDITYKND